MKLTNSVDGDSGCKPLLDVRDHTVGDLGVIRRIKIVVVQVENGARISCTGSLESDGDKVLTQDLREHGRAKRAVLVEDLVADVLDIIRQYFVFQHTTFPVVKEEKKPTQALILPLYLVMTVVMCLSRTDCSCALSRMLLTQLGSCECQHRVWPRIVLLFVVALLDTVSRKFACLFSVCPGSHLRFTILSCLDVEPTCEDSCKRVSSHGEFLL